MQTSAITLSSADFTVKTSRDLGGMRVPWEVKGYAEDYRTAVTKGGFFDLSDWAVVQITGPDTVDYLNRMSTVNFKSAPNDRAIHGAFLTGRAGVVAMGYFLPVPHGFQFLVSSPQREIVLEHIEKFHFAENFVLEDLSPRFTLAAIWNPAASVKQALALSSDWPPLELHAGKDGSEVWRDDRRPDLYWVKLPKPGAAEQFSAWKAQGLELLGQRVFDYFRILARVPQVGQELSDKEIVLEGNFESPIARNKGCYPGQEVVERIYTYGQVNKKLLPVTLQLDSSDPFPPCAIPLERDGKSVGQVVSYQENPENPREAAGLAYIQKSYWNDNQNFSEISGLSVRLSPQKE